VGNGPQVDDAMEALVVEEPAPVEVAEDAHVVGAVPEQRVPLPRVRELDGLEPACRDLTGTWLCWQRRLRLKVCVGPKRPRRAASRM
jgi:hypothetical protein